ncbi:hypothetical protein NE865_03992 [Phthorimaea operculella]|nr:hypothetical protein NE865_03992 [Phthorimaea operculella]
MSGVSLHLLAVFALVALLFVCTSGHYLPFDADNVANSLDEDTIFRAKREIEELDTTAPDEFQTATGYENQEEEPGFWDRVVKVALKLFSKFVEWLNS